MRHYRFGMIAALFALGHLAFVGVLGALALTTDHGRPLWTVVARDPFFLGDEDAFSVPWGLTVAVLLVGAVQAWALWQVLRGRARGEPAHRGGRVGLLRLALYLQVGFGIALFASVPLIVAAEAYWFWTATEIITGLLQAAVVWLFFLVLRGVVSRGLRLFSLVAGLLACASGLGQSITGVLGLDTAVFTLAGGYGYVWQAWSVSILVAQARDSRWSAATVRIGVVAQVMTFLKPGGSMGISTGVFPWAFAVHTLIGAVSVFGLVWVARTAHELANPLPQPVPRRRPARAAARWWPVAAVAVVLPLVPAAVNLTHGMYLWIGPRGAIENVVRVEGGGTPALTWFSLDVFVGVGGPALLLLVTVLRRTRRLVRFTTVTLTVAAVVAFVSALTTTPVPAVSGDFFYEGVQIYPEGLFTRERDGELFFGVSPSWYGAALLASALLLLVLYPAAPAQRVRRHVVLAVTVTLLALGFAPVADQSLGPVTAAEDCAPYEPWRGEPRKPELTSDQRFVCSYRQAGLVTFADTTPDAVILAHGRRLCGVYTRNDPQEVARLQTVEGLRRDALTYPLAQICPGADAVVQAAAAEQELEDQEWEDDAQRMCDSTPRHRPLIRAAKAIRIKEPQWTDYGAVETYEPTEDEADPFEDGVLDEAQRNGLVAALPGHLMVLTHPDYDLCVTLETYTRRPPVETKGWDHVVEVGYRSPTGEIVLRDDLSGTGFPDLSLNGRAGHYRIRVHYDWFRWKGKNDYGQRLLIMAFPGKGDKPVTYRARRKQ
ncbi:hypothetical protein SAMN05421874_121118 [Nonomuraea maritima]|uniref:Uncharacterized protein n=1 Tax=Nonomuraea maritima TaxID=683260 RepID=A0A1G9K2L0_9ACTN|nr:hypothetical protein [Nonomuraea maritima]SDL44140.1 hypothetical protein SAMN05421874_121118 [Nonomuraea maritima]